MRLTQPLNELVANTDCLIVVRPDGNVRSVLLQVPERQKEDGPLPVDLVDFRIREFLEPLHGAARIDRLVSDRRTGDERKKRQRACDVKPFHGFVPSPKLSAAV